MDRAMEIESASEACESPKPLVGRWADSSCRHGVSEAVPERQGQDGGFGTLQPPATNSS